MQIHPCSSLPPPTGDILSADKHVLHFLQNTYFVKSVNYKGRGKSGAVIALIDRNMPERGVVVKILTYSHMMDGCDYDAASAYAESANHELRIACMVNELAKVTPVFVHTVGWLVSRRIPSSWRNVPDFKIDGEQFDCAVSSYMFIFMEKVAYKFDDLAIIMTVDNVKQCLFVLLHGLLMARHALDFNHNDLHMGNIMFDISGSDEPLHLSLEHVDFSIHGMGYYPKFIDFGKSQTKTTLHHTVIFHPDVKHIFDAFSARFPVAMEFYNDTWKRSHQELLHSQGDNYQILLHFLIEDTLFDNGIVQKQHHPASNVKRQRVISNRCCLCGTAATVTLDTRSDLAFCTDFCALKLNKIMPLL